MNIWSARLEFSQDLGIDALSHWGCETAGRMVGSSDWEPLVPYGAPTENQTQWNQRREHGMERKRTMAFSLETWLQSRLKPHQTLEIYK